MNSYRKVELGTLISQAKTVRCGSGDYPILSMTMHDGLVFQGDKFKKVIASADKADYKVVYRNQLVISFPIDEGVLAAQRITDAGIVSPAYGIWNIEQSKLLPEFLECALRCRRALSYYKAYLRGSTARRRNLPTSTLLAFLVPLPSLTEQEEILQIIHKVRGICDTYRKQLSALDTLIKARFVEMFGDRKLPVCDLINLITEGAGLSYGIVQPGDNGTGDMGVLRPVDFIDGRVSFESLKYINRAIGDSYRKTELQGDELLITVRGTTGITALTDERFKGMNVTRGIAVIRCNRDLINPQYLNAYLNTDNSQRYIREHTRGATLQQINLSDLRVMQIHMPPIVEQNQFAAFVTQVDKSKFRNQTDSQALQIVVKYLWNLYMGGKAHDEL